MVGITNYKEGNTKEIKFTLSKYVEEKHFTKPLDIPYKIPYNIIKKTLRGEMNMSKFEVGQKKYCVDYTSGATGYGWEMRFDTIQEVEECIKDVKHDYSAKVSVYDYQFNGFIFYKRALSNTYQTDLIFNTTKRDLRTKTREVIQ